MEEYPFAREAICEAVYNAIAHNCYMYGTPIQIRVMEDAIIISNSCILPEGWTLDTLMEPHDSKPYNPDITHVFYRVGFIENRGQGIRKICDECKEIGAELPVCELMGTTFRIHFRALESALIDEFKAPKHQSIGEDGALENPMVLRLIEMLKEQPDISQDVLGERLGISRRVIQKYIKILKEIGKIERKGGKRYGYWKVK